MTTAEIIRIPLDSSDFTKFAQLWEKFQTEAKKQPELWKKIAQAQHSSTTQLERMSGALLAQNELDRQRKVDDGQHLKNLQQSETLWHRISTHSNLLFSNVLGISGQFLKWGGLLAGTAVGVTTGSLFGIDRLVSGIGGERQEAKGLGLSIGQQRAMDIDLGRFGNVQGLAQSVLGALTNPAQRTAWYALGLGAPTGNMSADVVRMLTAERAFALRTPLGIMGALAQAYQLPASIEDLMRLRGTSNAEFNAQLAKYQRDATALNIPDRSAETAQNVQNQFSRVWKQLETGLWGALAPLSGPIIRLSQAFTHASIAVLGSPAVKAGIKDFTDWINKFSTEMNSKKFDQELKGFMANVGIVADGIRRLATVMGKLGIGAPIAGYAGAKFGGMIGGVPGAIIGAGVGAGGYEMHKVLSNVPVGSILSGPMSSSAGAATGGLGSVLFTNSDAVRNSIVNAYRKFTIDVNDFMATPMSQGASSAAPVQISISFVNTPGANPVVSFNGLAGH